MKQTVRLAHETVDGIKRLKKIYENELGLKVHQGYVVNQAYKSIQGVDWVTVIKTPLPKDVIESITQENEKKTTLDLNDEVMDGITKMQEELPDEIGVKWVTVGYCIRLIIKAAILKLGNKI